MLNVAVVDDEVVECETLKKHLEAYASNKSVDFAIDFYSDSLEFVESFTNRYDVVFLDIEMPHLDGLELAHKIRERDEEVSIVFITKMKQYVIRGYEVDADDFIIKPVTYEDFSIKLDRVTKKALNKKNVLKIKINDNGIIKFVPLVDIRYVEVMSHKLTFHATDKSYESRGSLSKIEPYFLEHGFAKCNNYCLVNFRFVAGIEGYSLSVSKGKNKKDCDTLSVSHMRKKEFMGLLNKYLGVNG